MKTQLQPIIHRDAYTFAIEKVIREYLVETIFHPLEELIRDAGVRSTRANAIPSAVKTALDTGRIWYAEGKFSGKFSALISRELREMGAEFNSADGTFSINPAKMPMDLRDAVTQSVLRAEKLHATVTATLIAMAANIPKADTGIEAKGQLAKILENLDSQFHATVEPSVEIPMTISPAMRKALDEDLVNNLDLYVKDWAQDAVVKMRAEVQKNASAGFRTDRLAEIIQAKYGVGKRKAAFLAEQETSLLVSKYREVRYKSIGIREYIWSTSHDEKVRDDHRILDKTRHDWDSPPITNRATGARNNPGEDFRCRCVAIPIVEIEG